MANVMFDRLNHNETIIKNIDVPIAGHEVFLDGKTYKVLDTIKHFPEGGKGINDPRYKKLKIPFVRVLLIPS